MALPPGFLDELRERVSLSDLVGRKVTWDRRKSQPSKGDWWAPCPFHQEKTPSFHVDDRKGFYYCFGCHAKGDAITFLKEADNLSFIEAVERLAGEAGLEMPAEAHDPKAAERRDRQARLLEVMEEAARLFGLAFRGAGGAGVRAYAAKRGLSDETLKRFEIGYAPDARQHLTGHFREKGTLDEAVASGLVIAPEDGGAAYDRFRDRLIFPIRDGRGRLVAFGGRAMSDKAQAKYLNSPETELFSKGRVLYNMGPAREAAGKAGALVVAEGYMDVIALAQAGIGHAVAPLGTAVTEDQLQLLWRIAPEPVIALDGDKAGLRAAMRLVDLALPHLAPGRSLGFCIMPEGQDPDDLIKAGGRAAMEAALAEAVPLVEMLWRREAEAEPTDTPERRAALDQRLRAALGRIADRSVRMHYTDEVKRRRSALFAPRAEARPPNQPYTQPQHQPGRPMRRGRGAPWQAPQGPSAETRSSWLARPAPREAAIRSREAAILIIALANPEAAAPLEHEIEEMPLMTADYEPVRARLLDALGGDGGTEAGSRDEDIALLARQPAARTHPFARPGQPAERVHAALTEAIARHRAMLVAEAERAEAVEDFAEAEGEDWTWRVRQAALERQKIESEALQDSATNSDEGPSLAQQMLKDGGYRKKKRGPPPSNQ